MPKAPRSASPTSGPTNVKSGVLHAISLASVALSYGPRLRAEFDQAKTEIAHVREELAIKDAR